MERRLVGLYIGGRLCHARQHGRTALPQDAARLHDSACHPWRRTTAGLCSFQQEFFCEPSPDERVKNDCTPRCNPQCEPQRPWQCERTALDVIDKAGLASGNTALPWPVSHPIHDLGHGESCLIGRSQQRRLRGRGTLLATVHPLHSDNLTRSSMALCSREEPLHKLCTNGTSARNDKTSSDSGKPNQEGTWPIRGNQSAVPTQHRHWVCLRGGAGG